MEKLTKQEEEVMKRIWKLKSCYVKDIIKQLPEPKPPYTTCLLYTSDAADER